MGSLWQLPLPAQEDTTLPVVVYFYSDFWIPITCFCLSEAIALYRKALRQGKEICVFPLGLQLETKNILAGEASALPGEFAVQV